MHLWRTWDSWRTRGRPGPVKEKGRKEGEREREREKVYMQLENNCRGHVGVETLGVMMIICDELV